MYIEFDHPALMGVSLHQCLVYARIEVDKPYPTLIINVTSWSFSNSHHFNADVIHAIFSIQVPL